jgi:hypothetical protein
VYKRSGLFALECGLLFTRILIIRKPSDPKSNQYTVKFLVTRGWRKSVL